MSDKYHDTIAASNVATDDKAVSAAVNEILSIIENLGLAGIPMPEAVIKALEQLQKKP